MPTDPVCGMFVSGKNSIILEESGHKYYFCSRSCEIKFRQPGEAEKKTRNALAVAWAFSIPIILINYLFHVSYSNYLMFVLSLPVQFYSGLTFYKGAYEALKMKSGNMDLLVSIGTLTAFFSSVVFTFFPSYLNSSSTYFDAAAFIVSLILTGNYVQEKTELFANDAANKLLLLIPSKVHLLDSAGLVSDVETSEVKIGDIILVKPGENIPVDGTIVDGKSEIDESMLTGEAYPVVKAAGSVVFSGTLAINGAIRIKTDRLGADSTVNKIYALIRQAAAGKFKVQRIADIFSAYFVPVVIMIALSSMLFWYISLTLAGNPLSVEVPMLVFVSVIVIACPCAIGLAAPITVLISSNMSLKKGIIIKNSSSFDRLSKITRVVFDKTGTLTSSVPEVSLFSAKEGFSGKEILSYAVSAEAYSNHPVAKAILNFAEGNGIKKEEATRVEETPGMGISATVNGKKIELKRSQGAEEPLVNVFIDGSMAGSFSFKYPTKKDAEGTIGRFKSKGIRTAMITGDKRMEAEKTARELGIDDLFAEVSPEGKADIIKGYQEKGECVLYAGDGINDAIALETADVGVAMGAGSDIAKESGDIILLKDDIGLIYDVKAIGDLTLGKIKQNIGWAVVYNAILIPVAAGALVPFFGLSVFFILPILAAFAMGFSSVSVVLNSLLLRPKINKLN